LQELLDVLVRQSPELVRTTIDIAASEADIISAQGVDDWNLRATGAWSSKRRGLVEGNPVQTTAEDSATVTAEMSRSLSTGGTVGVALAGNVSDLTFSVIDSADDRIGIDTTALSGSLIASVTQPLLAGRGSRVARAPLRRASLSRNLAVLQRRAVAGSVVRDVITRYWDLSYAISRHAIAQQALELAQEQLRITRLAVEKKVSAPAEILAIEQAIAMREQDVLLADIEISERSLLLRQLVGLEIGPGEIALTTADVPDPGELPLSLDEALSVARERNPELAVARRRIETAAIDVEVASDSARSRLDLAASVGPDASASHLDDTFRQIGQFKSFTAAASLTYRQALGNRAASGAHRRTVAGESRAKADLAILERNLAADVVRAYNLVRTAKKRLEVSEVAIRLAATNLDNEKLLAQAGDARAFDVLARQDELSRAKLSRERALVDYLIAAVGVEALTGDLLPRYHIEISEEP
jgi:outer membrane protein TolC